MSAFGDHSDGDYLEKKQISFLERLENISSPQTDVAEWKTRSRTMERLRKADIDHLSELFLLVQIS